MNTSEDYRKREDKPAFMSYPAGGDIQNASKVLASKFITPQRLTEIPENVKRLAYMQYSSKHEDLFDEIVQAEPGTELFGILDGNGNYFKWEHNGKNYFIPMDADPFGSITTMLLKDAGWEFEKHLEMSHASVYTNETSGESYIMFKPNGGEPRVQNLTFKDIPIGRGSKDPLLGDIARSQLESEIELLKESGYNVKFTGYSLGGYLAKHWGSEFNIDQELLNAHIFPWNKFAETTAKTEFHTIATDPLNFKYKFPDFKGNISNDAHYTYPPPKDANMGKFTDHYIESMMDGERDMPKFENSMWGLEGEKIGRGVERTGNALAAAASGFSAYQDFKEGDNIGGVLNTGAAAAFLSGSEKAAGAAAPAIVAYSYGRQAYDAAKSGDTSTAAFKGTEAGIVATAPVAGAVVGGSAAAAALAGGVAIEGLGAVDEGITAYKDYKDHKYDHAAAHTVASVALTAGAGLAFWTGGLSLLIGGLVAGIAEASDMVGKHNYEKNEKRKHDEYIQDLKDTAEMEMKQVQQEAEIEKRQKLESNDRDEQATHDGISHRNTNSLSHREIHYQNSSRPLSHREIHYQHPTPPVSHSQLHYRH